MNTNRDEGTAVHERARERLFAAEIAAVLDAPLRVDESAGGRRSVVGQWLMAAMMLLGVAVAVGVGWLSRGGLDEAQQPGGFDPVFPAVDDVLWGDDGLFSVTADLEALSVLPERGVRRLAVGASRSGGGPASVEFLAAVARIQDLHTLLLSPGGVPSPEAIRELRAAPHLQTLALSGEHDVPFDAAIAGACAELVQLRRCVLSRLPMTREGLQALGTLPLLDRLWIDGVPISEEVAAAIGALRQLRSLDLICMPGQRRQEPLTASMLRSITAAPRLVDLGLSGFLGEPGALSALSPRLQAVRLTACDWAGAGDLRDLAALPGLRSLAWNAPIDAERETALAEVVGKVPLEQFEASVPVSPRLLEVLAGAPRLRGLRLQVGSDPGALVAVLPRLRRLELLRLACEPAPAANSLQPLQALANLRRVELVPNTVPGRESLDQLATELRAMLGERVQVAVK
ncbi:MAG: hypothetical protein U1F60_15180 [Planctomycetota bacterium]